MGKLKRNYKLTRKFLKAFVLGLRPSCIRARFGGPKLILNSIPKCGTNLVQEVIHRLPMMRGVFTKTITDKMGTEALRRISSIKNGQCIPAHIHYSHELQDALRKNNIKVIFVIRDFRDAILSHITYIDKIDVNHPHHAVFSNLKSMDEKIDACMNGIEGVFKAWPELVDGFKGWLKADDVLIIKYESLIANDHEAKLTILKIAEYLGVGNVDENRLFKSMLDKNGLTYNSPGIAKWKKAFTHEQISRINAVMGERLSFFGYEL